jgi:hypothetical protein
MTNDGLSDEGGHSYDFRTLYRVVTTDAEPCNPTLIAPRRQRQFRWLNVCDCVNDFCECLLH